MLTQRFKGVEANTTDRNWHLSKHLELTSEMKVSSMEVRERERLLRMAKDDLRLQSIAASLKDNRGGAL